MGAGASDRERDNQDEIYIEVYIENLFKTVPCIDMYHIEKHIKGPENIASRSLRFSALFIRTR